MTVEVSYLRGRHASEKNAAAPGRRQTRGGNDKVGYTPDGGREIKKKKESGAGDATTTEINFASRSPRRGNYRTPARGPIGCAREALLKS